MLQSPRCRFSVAVMVATNADAYEPSLVAERDWETFVHLFPHLGTLRRLINSQLALRGFHNIIVKKTTPAIINQSGYFSLYNLITTCILITLLFQVCEFQRDK